MNPFLIASRGTGRPTLAPKRLTGAGLAGLQSHFVMQHSHRFYLNQYFDKDICYDNRKSFQWFITTQRWR
jgi:hypothetical protein